MSLRARVKDAMLLVAGRTRAHRLVVNKLAGMATIFVLHRVLREGETSVDPALAVSEAFLNAAVNYVIQKGCAVVTLDELCQRARTGSPNQHMAVFTFDDGYRDNATLAARVFEKHRVPWCLYLTSGFPDRECDYWWGALERVLLDRDRVDIDLVGHRRTYIVGSLAQKRVAFRHISQATRSSRAELSSYLRAQYGVEFAPLLDEQAMSWAEVRQLVAQGLVEIGGHSMTHASLPTLDPAGVRRELSACRSRISDMIGVEVQHFAYPYGAAGDREYALARETGYGTAATAVASNLYAPFDDYVHSLPRVLLDGRNEHLSQVDVHLSGLTGLATLRARHPIWGRANRVTARDQST